MDNLQEPSGSQDSRRHESGGRVFGGEGGVDRSNSRQVGQKREGRD